MYDRILLPVDGSPASRAAVGHALDLAERYGATVHALYVVDAALGRAGAVVDALEREGEEATGAVERRAAEAGVEATAAIVEGVPHEEILEYADGHGADLVVVGTHGRRGLDRLVLGSVAGRVIRLAAVPVLAVPPVEGADPPYEVILLPTDGSAGAKAAAERAFDLARTYGAALCILSVAETGHLGPDVRSQVELGSLESSANESVETAVEDAREAGVADVAGATRRGDPSRAILEYADERGADLVVMGTHGRSGLRRYLLGSVTDRVVRSGAVPVLSVRATEE